jgi:hypothetical protein
MFLSLVFTKQQSPLTPKDSAPMISIRINKSSCLPKPQRCINIWSKSASLGLYQAIKKRLPIFKTSPYVQYAFVLENAQSSFADPIYTVLNSNFMQRWGKPAINNIIKPEHLILSSFFH